jgi:hypothetical protein
MTILAADAELNYCYAYGGDRNGFYINESYARLTNCVAKGFDTSGYAGFYVYNTGPVFFEDCTADDCDYGFEIYYDADNVWIVSPTATNCTRGIYSSTMSIPIYVYDPTFSGNTNDYVTDTNRPFHVPRFCVVNSGVHERKYGYASIISDTTDARSGTCIKFDPNSTASTRNPPIELGTVEVTSTASDLTLKVYMKDDSSFNGTVYLFAIQDGVMVVGRTEKTMTTSYVEQSVVVASADLTLNSYVTLYALVKGTAGNVFADDFSYSQ